MRVRSESPERTQALGERLGRLLRGRDVLCLFGELGSGKTTFVQGLCRGLGCRVRAVSPTFVLAKRYRGRTWTVHHLDLYRVAAGGMGDVGIEELLRDEKAVCAIEWPEAGGAYYPAERLELRFSHGAAPRERRIALKAVGKRPRELLRRLRAA